MLNKDDLVKYFIDGEKNPGDEKVGTEHEKFVYSKKDLSLIPFEGSQSILKIFDKFVNIGWEPIKEQDKIIALKKERASITLEPGGQFELSGAPLNTVHETCREINEHLDITKSIEEEQDIGFIGIGFLPVGSLDSVPIVPKKRYTQIMSPYMKKLGGLGLEMMYQSCTVQANIDFLSEKDMQRKINVAAAIQPLATGLFANSPFKEGRLNGYHSYRSYVWSKTDSKRTGILPAMLKTTFSFEEYVDYALNVPVYAIIRGNRYIDSTQYTFREILNGAHQEVKPEEVTIKDWTDHVSTIFTEVRLKDYIEMRGADAGGYKSLCALPAFWTGLLYCDDCLDEVIEIIKRWSYQEINTFKDNVAKIGLDAKIQQEEGWSIAKKILDISRKGLTSRCNKNSYGEDETIHLDYLYQIVNSKKSQAMNLIDLYMHEGNLNIDKLYQSESF